MRIGIGEPGIARRIIREKRHGAIELIQRGSNSFLRHLVPVVASLQIERIGFQIARASNGGERLRGRGQSGAESRRDGARDLILNRKNIREFAVEHAGPKQHSLDGVDGLG